MSVLTFTQLAPHARMNAVTSYRAHIEKELSLKGEHLDEVRELGLLPKEEQPLDYQEMLAVAQETRNRMLKRAGALDDDLYCIEHLRKDLWLFTAEGEYLQVK